MEDQELVPTTRNELWSWYINDWANSSYANACLPITVPLLLYSLCMQSACEEVMCDIHGESIDPDKEALLNFLGTKLRPESFLFGCISFSGLLQALVYISIGPIADFNHYRKRLFTGSSIAGSIGVCLYFAMADDVKDAWIGCAILLIFISVAFGLSTIAYNAYLPLLVESHDIITNVATEGRPESELHVVYNNLMNEISQKGAGLGNAGTLVIVGVTFACLLGFDATNYKLTPDDEPKPECDGCIEELFFEKVINIDIRYSENMMKSFRFQYENPVYNQYTRTFINALNASDDLKGEYRWEKGINSVHYWQSNDPLIASIHGIQFNQGNEGINGLTTSPIYGNDIGTHITRSSSSRQLAGWRADKYRDGRETMTSLTLLWKDPSYKTPFDTFGYRLAILISGLWWFVFMLIPIYFLKQRPGPDFPEGANWYSFGFKQTYKLFRKAKENKNAVYYLLAWFLFSDGLSTFASAAVIFAVKELYLTNFDIAIFLVIFVASSLLSNVIFTLIVNRTAIPQKSILIFHLIVMTILPIYFAVGAIPGAPFGLIHKWEMFVVSVIFGLNVGSLSSMARSVYALLIPDGKETEYYALFEITNKGSSWMGTAVVAVVSQMGTMRYALIYIFLFFLIPIPILYFKVDASEPQRATRSSRRTAQQTGTTSGLGQSPRRSVPRRVSLTVDPSIIASRRGSNVSDQDRVELQVVETEPENELGYDDLSDSAPGLLEIEDASSIDGLVDSATDASAPVAL